MFPLALQLGVLDTTIIVVYLAALLLIGWYFALRTHDSEDYLLGGRRMNAWAVGLSLFASLLSAISYLGYPAEMISYGPIILSGFIAYPFTVGVVGWILIPALMRWKVTTAYEILERRFHPCVRVLASLVFLAIRLIWMGLIIHLMATKMIMPLLEIDPGHALWVSAFIALITVAYSSIGGFRAVVVTDVVQTLILSGGALLALALIHHRLGGLEGWWPAEWPSNWQEPYLFFNPDDPMARTIVGAALAVFSWHVCTAGSDQMAIQRYLATRSPRAARRAFVTSMSADVVVATLLSILGLALLAYFHSQPDLVAEGKKLVEAGDDLFLRFLTTSLPVGVTGLVLAGLLAAAMSSLSSGVNAVSGVVMKDLIQRFHSGTLSEQQQLRWLRRLSWALGLLIVGLSVYVGEVDKRGTILQTTHTTVNLLVAPLFVPFLLALFVPWAGTVGALLGCVGSMTIAVLISSEFVLVNFLWLMPLSLLGGVAIGMLVSLVIKDSL